MKKIIITAISAIAVIASVIGCQIYDSQENTVLYSVMNAQGEGITSFEDLSADFNKKCHDFIDNSSDDALYNDVFESLFAFDEFATAVIGLDSDDPDFTGDNSKSVHNIDDVKEFFKSNYGTKKMAYKTIYAGLNQQKLVGTEGTGKNKVNVYEPDPVDATDIVVFKIQYRHFYRPDGSEETDDQILKDNKVNFKEFTFRELYQSQYQLKWDYNSKKGR